MAKLPVNREQLLHAIELKNLRHNYDLHVKNLDDINWLTMTITHKRTSQKQQYLTTLKGRLALELLKYKAK